MLEVYWGLFIAGVALVIITIIFGELIGGFLDGIFEFLSIEGPAFIHPMTFVGGMTILGGSGILLTQHTSWDGLYVFLVALAITLVANVILYFIYIRPMQNAENSTSYSIRDLIGKIGEVSVTIPVGGYGEVIVRSGAGNVNKIAASFDSIEIERGSQVVIVDVKDGTVLVSPFDLA